MPAVMTRAGEAGMLAGERPGARNVATASHNRAAATIADAVRLCRELAHNLNAEGFGLFFLGAKGEARRLAPVFDSSFPGALPITRMLSARGGEDFARRISDAAVPLWWRPAGGPLFLTASARCWAEEIEPPVADKSAIALPVSVERGRSGAVVFHGDDMVIDETRLCDTHARSFALFNDVVHQRVQDCSGAQPVSKREVECLRLTANGLTSEEIAASLGLSVHTANQYLTNSTHKLNAVNRIHAVAKALRSGLID